MKIIITERQNKMLMENIPVRFRRRFNLKMIKDHLDFTLLESLNPCNWNDTDEFVGDMCVMMVEDLINDFSNQTNEKLKSSVKDELYYFMVNTFGSYLIKFHKQQCA